MKKIALGEALIDCTAGQTEADKNAFYKTRRSWFAERALSRRCRTGRRFLQNYERLRIKMQ